MILSLTQLWVNLMSTGEGIAGASNRGKTQDYSVPGEVKTFANGRRRSVTVAGQVRVIPFSFVALDLTTKLKLESWAGQTVQVRDLRGQKWFGSFYSVSTSEFLRHDLYACTFSLESTTVVEGV